MRRLVVVAAVVALLAGGARAEGPKAIELVLHGAYVGATAFDTLTTIYGTSRGLGESNPLLAPLLYRGDYAAVWAIQAGAALVICAAVRYLCSDRETRWIGYAFMGAAVAFRLYCGIHNARLNHRVLGAGR